MTSLPDGWIEWSGGECPLSDGINIDARFRDGTVEADINSRLYAGSDPHTCVWQHDGSGDDIVAYRIADSRP